MEVKEQVNLADWKVMAVPQIDGSDNKLFVKYVRNSTLQLEPEAKEDEPKLFNNRVALRHFALDDDFLQKYEHASFSHSSIQEAEHLIALWPEIYEQCGVILNAFNPLLLKGIEDQKNHGGSNSYQPKNTLGAVCATVHNPILLAQALVHGLAHNKLFSLGQHFESQAPLFKNEKDELFDSPVRLDILRPISAVFHGIYAFAHVLVLDRILFEKSNSYDKTQFLGLLKLNALRVKKGAALIEKCAKLTSKGEAFVGSFLKWAKDEVAQALKIYQTNTPTKKTPIVIIGPNSQEKFNIGKRLQEEANRNFINAEQVCWNIWAQSSVVKQKQMEVFGSTELINLFGKSNKFSNKEFLQNWIRAGVFNQQELEFMKLQLCNYLLKNFPNSVIYFGEDHVLLEHPDFLKRLNQLFNEYNTKVVYARPVLSIESAVKALDVFDSEERKKKLWKILNLPAYRTISNHTFDTEQPTEESINDLLSTLFL